MNTAIVLTGLFVPLLAASAYYLEDHWTATLPAGDGPVEATLPMPITAETSEQ